MRCAVSGIVPDLLSGEKIVFYMHFFVALQDAPLVKTFITLVALILFLPRICSLVLYKITSEDENFLILVAMIWFLSSVYSSMFYYTSFPS